MHWRDSSGVLSDSFEQHADLDRTVETRLLLEALGAERWVARAALTEKVREVFESGVAEARRQAATEQANIVLEQALSGTDLA